MRYLLLGFVFILFFDFPAHAQDKGGTSFEIGRTYPFSVEEFFTAGVALGDLDGDGDLDLVEANGRHWAQTSYVYYNADNRGYTSRIRLGKLDRTSYLTLLSDLDQDGDLDIIAASDKMENQIYFNDGKGNFGDPYLFGTIQSNTRSLTIADVNGDGFMDILEICRGMPNNIFLNDGKGGMIFHKTFGDLKDSTLSVAIEDMDGDGHLDFVLANRDGQQNKILLDDGDLNFPNEIPYGNGGDDTRGVKVGDMNGDGLPDVITANIGEQNQVILNRGNGVFEESQFFGNETGFTFAIEVVDLDGDGDLDVVVGNSMNRDGNGKNEIYLNEGNGRLVKSQDFGLEDANTYALAVGDVDGDGKPDIAIGNSAKANFIYYQK